MKRVLKIALFLCLALTAWASTTVNVVFVDGGSISDGKELVGPYNLLIDNKPVAGPCISYTLHVNNGETWTATETPIVDFSDAAQRKLYLEAAWLDTQFAVAANATIIASIQYAIWDLFDTAIPFPETVTHSTKNPGVGDLIALAATNYTSISPSSFSVLIPVSGTQRPLSDGTPQSFLIETGPPTAAPEPGAFSMLLGGIGLIGIGRIIRRKRAA